MNGFFRNRNSNPFNWKKEWLDCSSRNQFEQQVTFNIKFGHPYKVMNTSELTRFLILLENYK